MRYEDIDPDDKEAHKTQRLHWKRYKAQLSRHHSCRDPEHPGCPLCDEDYEDDPDYMSEWQPTHTPDT